MNNYGYCTVDFKGVDFAAAAAKTVTGLYAQLQSVIGIGKPVLGFNLVRSTTSYTPMWVYISVSSGTFTVYANGEIFTVSSADSVTITTPSGT